MTTFLAPPNAFVAPVADAAEAQTMLTMPRPTPSAESLNRATVAELTHAQISNMTRQELIRVIETAQMRLLAPDIADRLRFRDRATLERLSHLAHRCCRHQLQER